MEFVIASQGRAVLAVKGVSQQSGGSARKRVAFLHFFLFLAKFLRFPLIKDLFYDFLFYSDYGSEPYISKCLFSADGTVSPGVPQ
jgi:hypothetical protein